MTIVECWLCAGFLKNTRFIWITNSFKTSHEGKEQRDCLYRADELGCWGLKVKSYRTYFLIHLDVIRSTDPGVVEYIRAFVKSCSQCVVFKECKHFSSLCSLLVTQLGISSLFLIPIFCGILVWWKNSAQTSVPVHLFELIYCSPPRSGENLEMLLSVCPSVRLSFRPSHTCSL